MLTLETLPAAIVAGLPPQYRGAVVLVDTGGAKEIRVRLMLDGDTLAEMTWPQECPLAIVQSEALRGVLAAILRTGDPVDDDLTIQSLPAAIVAALPAPYRNARVILEIEPGCLRVRGLLGADTKYTRTFEADAVLGHVHFEAVLGIHRALNRHYLRPRPKALTLEALTALLQQSGLVHVDRNGKVSPGIREGEEISGEVFNLHTRLVDHLKQAT